MNHRRLLTIRFLLALACVTMLIRLSVTPSAAQADLAAELLVRINAARVAQGLPPYALNDKLNGAAQAHSKDMAATGRVDRAGSDGSTPKSRILAAGYSQWSIGPVVDEAIYGGTGGVQGAFDWWMGTEADKARIHSTRFREVGIGAATAPNGWTYWTLDLGAQPNVLPAFVNNGVTSVEVMTVTLTLTTEGAVPAGEGTTTIGQPMQIRVASDDSFTGADWQPWAAQVPFKLLPRAQQKIYVLYRDAQGRTAPYSISVILTNVPPTATFTPSPTFTWTPPPSITPLPSNTPRPTGTAPPTRTPIPTVAGGPSATPAVGAPETPPTAAPSPLPSTPRATLRPRVTPTIQAGPYGSAPRELMVAVCGLQAVAFALAALVIARRSLNRMPPAPTQPSTGTEHPSSETVKEAEQ
jgi:uncharacterized protein YkwD